MICRLDGDVSEKPLFFSESKIWLVLVAPVVDFLVGAVFVPFSGRIILATNLTSFLNNKKIYIFFAKFMYFNTHP